MISTKYTLSSLNIKFVFEVYVMAVAQNQKNTKMFVIWWWVEESLKGDLKPIRGIGSL